MIVEITWELRGEELQAFLDFVYRITDSFSVARYFNGKLSEETVAEVQTSYRALLEKENQVRRKRYEEDPSYYEKLLPFLRRKEKAQEYFDDLYRQDMELLDEIQFQLKGDDQPFETGRKDFIRKEYTRDTTVTRGPLFEVCYFKMGETWEAVRTGLSDLFQRPFMIDETSFEDLACYQDGQVKMAVCSHEGFCSLDLTEQEIEEFKKLGIEYRC